jgi:glycosyltransferase involved in cell wall biosynthesis
MTIKKNLISVIIPCWNAGIFLKKTLDSVLNQTYSEYEIIIVNDGSTDSETINVIKSYHNQNNKKIKVINQSNVGLPAARNIGIKKSKGEYFFFLDSDDWIEKDCLEILLKKIKNKKNLYACSYFETFQDENYLLTPTYNFFELLFSNQLPYCCLFPRSIIKKFGSYDEKMIDGFEDWELHIKLAKNNVFPAIVKKVLFHYRVSAKGMLKSKSLKKYSETLNYIRRKHEDIFSLSSLITIYSQWKLKKSKYYLLIYFIFNTIILFANKKVTNFIVNVFLSFLKTKNFFLNYSLHKNNKILHVITSLDTGGAEKTLVELILASKDKYEHSVICLKEKGNFSNILLKENIEVTSLGMKKNKMEIKKILRFFSLVSNARPKLIQSWLYHSDLLVSIYALLNPFHKFKVIWTLHNNNLNLAIIKLSTKILVIILAVISYLQPKKIISVSESGAQTHIKNGYNKKIFSIIPPYLDFSKIKNYSSNYSLSPHKQDIIFNRTKDINKINKKIMIIGSLARWNIQKNHRLLCEGLGILKKSGFQFCLVMAGREIDKTNISLIKMLKTNNLVINKDVYLMGETNDIPSFFKLIDISLITSISESYPVAAVESMYFSVPCVASNVGDIKNIIGNQGWIFKNGDVNDLCLKLLDASVAQKNANNWQNFKVKCHNRIIKKVNIRTSLSKQYYLWNKLLDSNR